MITISLNVNGTSSIASTSATTIRQLASEKLSHTNVTAKINGAAATLDSVVRHADSVELAVVAAPAVQVSPTTQAGAGYASVTFINNDGAGFADKLTVAVGLTIAQLIQQKGINPSRYMILINGQPATREQVLNNGDKVSVTPVKIEGAADILFVNNDGAGFAEKLSVIDGITLRQFFSQRTQASDPSRYTVRVNGLPATSDQVLNNGDKVSITPLKIQGAV